MTATHAFLSPTLAEVTQRYAMARQRAQALADRLDEAAFHRPAADGGWSVAQCLEHLTVVGAKTAANLETAIVGARAAGRFAAPGAARAPLRLDWFSRLFVAAMGAGRTGQAPPMKMRTRPPFEPDAMGAARPRAAVLGDFLALQDRLEALARAADGLDLAGVKAESSIAAWIRVSIGGWFVSLAGHQERHLDQAERAAGAA